MNLNMSWVFVANNCNHYKFLGQVSLTYIFCYQECNQLLPMSLKKLDGVGPIDNRPSTN